MRSILLVLLITLVQPVIGAEALPTSLFRNLRAGRNQVVVVYGTSLTHYGPWVKMLQTWFEEKYPGKTTVINSGASGMQSAWGLANVKERVCDKKPDLVFIEFAINDASIQKQVTVDEGLRNLDGIVKAVRTANPAAEFVLQTMNPAFDAGGKTPGADRPQLDAYYANYTGYATQNRLPIIDNYAAWKKLASSDQKSYQSYLPDGIHPNAAGIKAVTWPNIERLLLAADLAASRRAR